MNIARNDIFAILRIQNSDFLDRNIEHLCNLTEVNTIVHLHGIDNERLSGKSWTDVMLSVIGHSIICRDESRHISTSLLGQIVINFPKVGMLGSCSSDGFVHVAWSTVIGSDGKSPVAIGIIKLLEVLRSHFARAVWVATLVNERANLKPESLTSSNHKLPQAASSCWRHSIGVESRLNDWDILELEWHLVSFKSFFKDGHIIRTHAKHLCHKSSTSLDISLNVAFNNLIERHFNHSWHFSESADVFVITDISIIVTFDTTLIDDSIVFKIPVLHHLLGIGLET